MSECLTTPHPCVSLQETEFGTSGDIVPDVPIFKFLGSLAKGTNNCTTFTKPIPIEKKLPVDLSTNFSGAEDILNNWFSWSDLLAVMFNNKQWINWRQLWEKECAELQPWVRKRIDTTTFSPFDAELAHFNYSPSKWFAILYWHGLIRSRWHLGIALKSSDGEELVVPHKMRGMPSYHWDTIEKIKRLEAAIPSDMPLVHMRLSPQTGRFTNLFEALEAMEVAWHKMLNVLERELFRRRYGVFKDCKTEGAKKRYRVVYKQYGGRIKVQYLKVYEPHKSGYPHLHIIFFDITYLVSKPILDAAWERYGMGTKAGVWINAVNRKGSRNRSKTSSLALVKYTIKYVSQGLKHPLWLPILFLLNKKSYSCSQDISAILKGAKKGLSGYIYLGSDFYVLLTRLLSEGSTLATYFELLQDIKTAYLWDAG